mgnify:FL=1|tara:strand:- start:59 stop:289 length:231 start_codon:yes stop_codon:yes gene_type:complete
MKFNEFLTALRNRLNKPISRQYANELLRKNRITKAIQLENGRWEVAKGWRLLKVRQGAPKGNQNAKKDFSTQAEEI